MVRKLIKEYRHLLTRQQVTTLNGQIKADNEEGALKGLKKILKRQDINFVRKSQNASIRILRLMK